ncbi:MAG: hypothetical protein C3F17_17830 [Bradyrhizobiaceae bacterium]|nr:MAG: hypothetical protein C3F17_17830 [Bradyrhizobiaceae bacterium]
MTAMTIGADLVMPKLGLTMTEGTLARWAIAPGALFAAGDTIAVVETDKIAYDVEAPGTGTLAEILVGEGETVAVGTPIARWLASDGPTVAPREATQTPPAPPTATPSVIASAGATGTGDRIIATPYARRLARDAGLDLAAVTAANGRRIRAADIEVALARRAEARTQSALAPAGAPNAAPPSAAGFAFYGVDVRVDRLAGLLEEIDSGMPDLQPSPIHFVALAAARVLEAAGGTIGLQHEGRAARHLPPETTRRLSTIVAADRAEVEAESGTATLIVSDAAGAAFLGRAPTGRGATLGVGALTSVFRPDAEGRPVLCSEISLVLTVSEASTLSDASGFLSRVRTFLESPLVLLAS